MNESIELCPICIEKPSEYFTECGHSFCINCLCRIKKCAICRKSLLREKLCKDIKENFTKKQSVILERETWVEINTILDNISSTRNINEEYDEFGRIINPSDEYTPIISYYGQFPSDPIPSRTSRWIEDETWQVRRGMLTYIHSPNRISRWGDYSRN